MLWKEQEAILAELSPDCVQPHAGLSRLLLSTTLGSRVCLYPHFMDVETELSQLVSGRAGILNHVCPAPRSTLPTLALFASPAWGCEAANLVGVAFNWLERSLF